MLGLIFLNLNYDQVGVQNMNGIVILLLVLQNKIQIKKIIVKRCFVSILDQRQLYVHVCGFER
jgi:hypothetical protein